MKRSEPPMAMDEWGSRLTFVLWLFVASGASAQTATVPPARPLGCAQRAAQEKAAWGKTPHTWIENVFEKEDVELRAPDAVSFSAQYERAIKDPVGFVFFYDLGKVGLARSDLDLNHLHHSFGAGLTVRAGGYPVLNFYYAWAGHEGTHTIITGNTDLLDLAADDPRLLSGPLPPW